MSMATNELIKLTKIENNLDLNKIRYYMHRHLYPPSSPDIINKKVKTTFYPSQKLPLIFIEKMEIDNMNPGHAH